MMCTKCKRPLIDGDMIQCTVLSIYHSISGPGMDAFKYAIEKPHSAIGIKHVVCEYSEGPEGC